MEMTRKFSTKRKEKRENIPLHRKNFLSAGETQTKFQLNSWKRARVTKYRRGFSLGEKPLPSQWEMLGIDLRGGKKLTLRSLEQG